jgi:hypothetical protein
MFTGIMKVEESQTWKAEEAVPNTKARGKWILVRKEELRGGGGRC